MAVTNRFGIFAKYWRAGTVKTRLATDIGAEPAAALHAVFVRTLLRRFATFPASRVLCFSPPESEPEFAAITSGAWQMTPQSSGDLGARMKTFFRDAFDQGYTRVVLIGSDSPTLPVSLIELAFQSLQTHPVVIGPSADGGYYLIGIALRGRVSEQVPPIFDDMPWSTPRVFQQTLDRLADARVPVAQLRPWYDVDELQDLRRLAAELAANGDPTLQELRETVSSVLGCKR